MDNITNGLVLTNVYFQFSKLFLKFIIILGVLNHYLFDFHPFLFFLLHVVFLLLKLFIQPCDCLFKLSSDHMFSNFWISINLFQQKILWIHCIIILINLFKSFFYVCVFIRQLFEHFILGFVSVRQKQCLNHTFVNFQSCF